MTTIIASAIGFILTTIGVFGVKRYLGKLLVDIPNDRSSHIQETPRGGGIGFIIAFAIASCLTGATDPLPLPWFWLSLAPLIIVGVLDDWRGVPSLMRYLVQLGTASVMVYHTHAFPQPWLDSLGGVGMVVAIGLTVIGITAGINFYNFMDGLDGLVAGVTAVQLGFLAIWCDQPVLWLLVAGLLGFICWNWAPAKIFMGDAGSTFLGAVVASVLLNETDSGHAWTVLTIALPLVGDAIYTIVRRLQKGENIFRAHRNHLYQRLQQAGLSHERVTAIYMAATMAVGLLVSRFGSVGAEISAIGVVVAIGCGELYLRLKGAKFAKVDNSVVTGSGMKV